MKFLNVGFSNSTRMSMSLDVFYSPRAKEPKRKALLFAYPSADSASIGAKAQAASRRCAKAVARLAEAAGRVLPSASNWIAKMDKGLVFYIIFFTSFKTSLTKTTPHSTAFFSLPR